MLPDISIDRPFAFNLLKHHWQFAWELSKHYKETDRPELVSLLHMGGNLWCDYYYGSLPVTSVLQEIKHSLSAQNTFETNEFTHWISGTSRKFRNLLLSDGSEWTLLIGEAPDRYVHIHPARHSRFTVRARFLALKTALLLLTFYGSQENIWDVQYVNKVRVEILDAAPVKQGGDLSHLTKIVKILAKVLERENSFY